MVSGSEKVVVETNLLINVSNRRAVKSSGGRVPETAASKNNRPSHAPHRKECTDTHCNSHMLARDLVH